ncbi:MAG TPA: hypothetical protein VN612_13925, partial [Acidobacteriaceae bacterium]|nr:hypothetical protein [Acidobacteriaceae bacterium]
MPDSIPAANAFLAPRTSDGDTPPGAAKPRANGSAAAAAENDRITIRGARTHNLKSVDVDIPHNALTVV